jgi:hypothetical protein
MAINQPAVNVDDYMISDEAEAAPKHGTTIQAGWEAANALLKPKKETDYAIDFKFGEQQQLVRFLEDEPFMVYQSHWVEREGKKSFVCLGDDCPLCTIADEKARGKFAFNVLALSEEEPSVQILTAPPTLARQLKAANDDPRRGPLTKYYWSISRQGSGPQTQYTLDRVKPADLAEEWELNPDTVDELVESAKLYDHTAVYETPRTELLQIARSLVNR